ncbi:uncharacterized protein [Maniola hyperantus]|uniref:uncharacterized protein isoform X3 n=1 Tax=Aphantopus hyperantus TaxID=2795564 RepID=UPI00374A0663
MSKFRVLAFLFLFLLKLCNEVYGGCNITLNSDLGNPSPVYIHNGGFLAPNSSSGAILLRRSETLEVACPGDRKFVVLGNDSTEYQIFAVKCVKDTTFRATKTPWVGTLKDIRCNAPPWFTTELTGASCSGAHRIYRIGYRIGSKFYELYEACFDEVLLRTLYVKQQLKPESKFIQTGRRSSFVEGDVFGKVKMSKAYKIENQKLRLKEILGSGMEDKYVTKSQALRRRVHAYGRAVTVYTGTNGICTLPDSSDVHRQVYLTTDQNNNRVVPVPMYFYKVVYDPTKQTAVAFISINSSYYNNSMIDELAFCDDVCEHNPQFSWLRWRPKDGTHSFCCNYEDFVKTIHDLPKLNVRGLFY